MQHALILTKNILSEEALVNKLQRMNYETLCSTDLLKANRLQNSTTCFLLDYFQWVIVSETLSNQEMEDILSKLNSYPMLTLIRIAESYPGEEDQSYWKKRGLADWLIKDASFEDTREKLSSLQSLHRQEVVNNKQILSFPIEGQTETSSNNLEKLYCSFSKKEKKVFEYLMKSYPDQGVVSRNELCDHLWEDGETASNMSQLSCLINKLKRKCELHGIKGEAVKTFWGRGYKLSDEVYQLWIHLSQPFDDKTCYTATN